MAKKLIEFNELNRANQKVIARFDDVCANSNGKLAIGLGQRLFLESAINRRDRNGLDVEQRADTTPPHNPEIPQRSTFRVRTRPLGCKYKNDAIRRSRAVTKVR
jgi:hypothetical protein